MRGQPDLHPDTVAMIAPYSLTHVIPARAILAEETRLAAVLLAAGIDPVGLRLDQPAIDCKLRDLDEEATARNITVVSRGWITTLDGDVEVVLGFEREADAVVMKLALG